MRFYPGMNFLGFSCPKIQKGEFMEKNKKFSILNYYKEKKFTTLFYVLLTASTYLFDILATFKLAQFMEYISSANYDKSLKVFLITAIYVVAGRFCRWISSVFFYNLAKHLNTSIKRDLATRCVYLESNSFNKIPSGKLNTRITSDPEQIVWAMDSLIENLALIVSGLASLVLIMSYNLYIGLIIGATIIGLTILEFYKQKAWSKNTKALNKTCEHISTYSNEIIRSEKDIKSLNMESALLSEADGLFKSYGKNFSKKYHTNGNLWSLRSALVDFLIIGVVVLAISFVKNGTLGISAFLFIILNRSAIREVIWSCGNLSENINTCKISAKRINDIMDESKFPTETFGDKTLENCKGEIEFKNVSFAYEEIDLTEINDKKEDKEPIKKQVFKDFNLVIPANKTVALVGRSGCGKSTILNLIPKLYKVDSGEVKIDGINVNDLTRNSIRENISLVSQFPYIFDKTIKENLLLAKPNATDEEIESVIKKANMDFVYSMPNGLNTLVGEGGIKLSGGQKQRLAIARALLKNTRIILFDESTSSLDNFSQNEIKKSIDALSHDSTVVIVAHRLSTIKNADIIYFIENGKVEAQGSFDGLFETNEKFQQLFVAENI